MTDEEGVRVCQREIKRLRSVVREYNRTAQTALDIDYRNLFDTWADFDDAESPKAVTRLIETSGLGPVDALSFSAFCYGYERAMRKIKEAL